MPRLLIFGGGIVVVLVVVILILNSLGKNQAANTPAPNLNIPVSSSVSDSSGPSLDSSPSAITNAQNFAILSSTPKNNDTNIPLNAPVILTFNRNFDSSSAAVVFTPDVQYTLSSTANTVALTPNGSYLPNTKYQLQVNIPSLNYSTTLNFTTVNVATPTPSPTSTPIASSSASPTQ